MRPVIHLPNARAFIIRESDVPDLPDSTTVSDFRSKKDREILKSRVSPHSRKHREITRPSGAEKLCCAILFDSLES